MNMNKNCLTLCNFIPIVLSIYIIYKTFGAYTLCDGENLNQLTEDLNVHRIMYTDYTIKYNVNLEYLFKCMDAGDNRSAMVFSNIVSSNRFLMIKTFSKIRLIEKSIIDINPGYISNIKIAWYANVRFS